MRSIFSGELFLSLAVLTMPSYGFGDVLHSDLGFGMAGGERESVTPVGPVGGPSGGSYGSGGGAEYDEQPSLDCVIRSLRRRGLECVEFTRCFDKKWKKWGRRLIYRREVCLLVIPKLGRVRFSNLGGWYSV